MSTLFLFRAKFYTNTIKSELHNQFDSKIYSDKTNLKKYFNNKNIINILNKYKISQDIFNQIEYELTIITLILLLL